MCVRVAAWFRSAALRILKPERPARAVVKLGEQWCVLEDMLHAEMLVISNLGRKDKRVEASSFRFHDSECINFTFLNERGSIPMTLSQPNKRQRLLTNRANMSILTAPEKREEVFAMIDAAAWMHSSEEAKQAM